MSDIKSLARNVPVYNKVWITDFLFLNDAYVRWTLRAKLITTLQVQLDSMIQLRNVAKKYAPHQRRHTIRNTCPLFTLLKLLVCVYGNHCNASKYTVHARTMSPACYTWDVTTLFLFHIVVNPFLSYISEFPEKTLQSTSMVFQTLF